MAVRAGDSGTNALKSIEPALRPGVQSLSFHVWRWLGTAQVIRSLLAKRAPAAQVDALLCVALTLLSFDAPVFAKTDAGTEVEQFGLHYDAFTLVDQAVEAAKRNPNTKASSSFINACLRRFLREKDALTAAAVKDPVGRWNHPLWWINRVKLDYPQNWQDVLQFNNSRAPLTLRINARKTTVSAYLNGLSATNVGATRSGEYGVTLDKPVPVEKIAGFLDGVISVQDAAAQFAAPLLMRGNEAKTDFHVLDACAAPGGKTAHLLEIADCQVTALDVDPARCELISETLSRLRLKAQVLAADAAQPETWHDKTEYRMFDAILLDAPCTASGIVRRHPDIRWLRREGDVLQLAAIQGRLLDALWALLKPGGRLLYCTCSVFKAEGQSQLDLFMINNKNAALLPSPGHLISKYTKNHDKLADNELTNHDGFFYALLEKASP